jgi:hypothetical protein
MKYIFIAAAVLIGTSSSAFAKHCPQDAKIIAQSMKMAMGLDKMQMSTIQVLHDAGLALHKAGEHALSIKTLHEATMLLKVEPYKG